MATKTLKVSAKLSKAERLACVQACKTAKKRVGGPLNTRIVFILAARFKSQEPLDGSKGDYSHGLVFPSQVKGFLVREGFSVWEASDKNTHKSPDGTLNNDMDVILGAMAKVNLINRKRAGWVWQGLEKPVIRDNEQNTEAMDVIAALYVDATTPAVSKKRRRVPKCDDCGFPEAKCICEDDEDVLADADADLDDDDDDDLDDDQEGD